MKHIIFKLFAISLVISSAYADTCTIRAVKKGIIESKSVELQKITIQNSNQQCPLPGDLSSLECDWIFKRSDMLGTYFKEADVTVCSMTASRWDGKEMLLIEVYDGENLNCRGYDSQGQDLSTGYSVQVSDSLGSHYYSRTKFGRTTDHSIVTLDCKN